VKVIEEVVGSTFGESFKMESCIYLGEDSDEQVRLTFDQK
jgi:hypothetical protein